MLRLSKPGRMVARLQPSSLRSLPIPARRALHSVVHSSSGSGSTPGFFTPSPPSSSPGASPSSNGAPSGRERVSDHEYQVRLGRASDLLRATLPDFMRTGLVDYQNHELSQSSGLTLLDVFTFRALQARPAEDDSTGAAADQVYDPRIHFLFRPAPPPSNGSQATSASPTDEEAASVSFSGRSLYFASAHVLRHTLNVLFSETKVELGKLRLECRADRPRIEDILHVRLHFTGHLRVTGQEHRLTLIFRYDFNPDTGRIVRHTVERVEPAIGRKLWTGIATVWQRLLGHQQPTPVPSACHMHNHRRHTTGRPEKRDAHIVWDKVN